MIIGAVLLVAAALAAVLAMQAVGDRLYAEVWKDGSLVEQVALEEQTDRRLSLMDIIQWYCLAKRQNAVCGLPRPGLRQDRNINACRRVAVCLPNRVMLKITGGQSDIDAIVS